jgi:putative NADPH-quinone reductase
MRVYLVHCHPMGDSFVAAVRDRAVAALEGAGHEVRVTDLYAEGFRPELSTDEHVNHLADPSTKPEITPYADLLRWCEALVLVYPTWWSGQPAMLKGWIDRVWVRGVAYELPEGANRIRPALTNIRRIVAVTTHGSSKWVNAVEGETGKRIVTRALRILCHPLARSRWIALYSIDRCDAAGREAFLRRVERRLARL